MPVFQNLISNLRDAERQLVKQLNGIRDAIASLESEGPGARGPRGRRAGGRRGRRGMSAAARKAVSIRMKKYWAERRKAKAK